MFGELIIANNMLTQKHAIAAFKVHICNVSMHVMGINSMTKHLSELQLLMINYKDKILKDIRFLSVYCSES